MQTMKKDRIRNLKKKTMRALIITLINRPRVLEIPIV